MSDPLEEVGRLLREGKDTLDLAITRTTGPVGALLRRCAVVRTFDRKLVEGLLRRIPTELEPVLSFEALSDLPFVEPVPRPRGTFRLNSEARRRFIARWASEDVMGLARLRAQLVAYYREPEHHNALEELYHLVAVDTRAARGQFERLYAEAEDAFDLARCERLLALFNEVAPVTADAIALLWARDERRARLNARSLWADEFYRTGSYLQRARLTADLEELLTTTFTERWAFLLHASGGTGKTMFLRWAIARWCVPRGIPCARIDFDEANPLLLAADPRLLALEIARQWNRQLVRTPLDELIARLSGSSTAANTQPLAQLASSLELPASVNALVVLDTLEEVLIPHRPALLSILDHLATLHAAPGGRRIRFILSGRYDLRSRLVPEILQLGGAPIVRKVFRFKDRESRDFLTRLRGLPDDDRTQAAIERARGNPLKLWLYSEILASEPDLSAEKIRAHNTVDVEYLIRRVVLRIGENDVDPSTGEKRVSDLHKQLRWVLRYGVIPSRLTRDFLATDMMRERLEREVRGENPRDEPDRGLEPWLVEKEPFPRAEGSRAVDVDVLWSELKAYAGGASWVRAPAGGGGPDVLIFTPDVVNPMRALLLEQEHALFQDLHADALRYYEAEAERARAENRRDDRLRCLREAVYHDFQRRGEEAGAAWRTLLESSEVRCSPAWMKVLAGEVTGRSYIEDDDTPRPILRNDGRRMIAPAELAMAFYWLARASVDLARSKSASPDQEWRTASNALRRCKLAVACLRADQYGPIPDRVSLLEAVIFIKTHPVDDPSGLAQLRVLQSSDDPDVKLEALREEADLLFACGDPDAGRALAKWLALATHGTRGGGPLVDPTTILEAREKFARHEEEYDRLDVAIAACDLVIEEARLHKQRVVEARLDLLARSILIRAGRPDAAQGERPLPGGGRASPKTSPATWKMATWFQKAESCLNLGNPRRALDFLREGRKQRSKAIRERLPELALIPDKPSERLLRSRIAVAMMDYRKADEELRAALSAWNDVDRGVEAERPLADTIAFNLHDLGNLVRAAPLLDRAISDADLPRSESLLRLALLDVELVDLQGRASDARARVDDVLAHLDRRSPPRFRVRAALAGLARRGEPTPEPYLEALNKALADVTPVSARLVMLAGLDRCPVCPGLPDGSVSRFLELIAGLPEEPLTRRERATLELRHVEAFRVVGRGHEAGPLLATVQSDLLREGETAFTLVELLRAHDRLGLHAEAMELAREWLPRFVEEFRRDDKRVLIAAVWLEQAERALIVEDDETAEAAVRQAKELEILRSSWLAVLRARLFDVRRELASRAGRRDDAERFGRTALALCRENGLNDPQQLVATRFLSPLIGRRGEPSPTAATAAVATLAPLFPTAPAFTVRNGWDYDEGFWITTNPPSGTSRTTVPDPSFLMTLGWGLLPSGESRAPFEHVSLFDKSWREFAEGLAGLVVVPETSKGLAAWLNDHEQPADLRLELATTVLWPLPWEFLRPVVEARASSEAARSLGRIYRSSAEPGTSPAPVRWLQLALRELVDANLEVDGVDSPRLRTAIETLQAQTVLPVTGQADAETRWMIERRLRTKRGSSQRRVVFLEAIARNDGSLSRVDPSERVRALYDEAGYHGLRVPEASYLRKALPAFLLGAPLSIVHIMAPLAEEPTLGVHFLIGEQGGSARSPDGIITPQWLDETLRSLPDEHQKPLVILDPPRPRSRFEAVRQLFLRNAFEAELFRLGNAPVVLGTGLADTESLESLIGTVIRLVTDGLPVGFVADLLRQSVPDDDEPALDQLLYCLGTTLFAHDPDARMPGAGDPVTDRDLEDQKRVMQTRRRLFALLVGIDAYPGPLEPLRGCINDVRALAEFLEARVLVERGVRLELVTLTDAEATRAGVIKQFRTHLINAGPGDVVLFGFCGRGSRQSRPEALGDAGPSGLDDTLVLHDSRQLGSWDLAVPELAGLVDEVTARGANVTLILDCSHAGAGSSEPGALARWAPSDARPRPVDTFLVSMASLVAATRQPIDSSPSAPPAPPGRTIVLSACRDEQEASEFGGGGRFRGTFSYFLGQAVTSASGAPTYRDLIARTAALVSTHSAHQMPRYQADRDDDLDAVFLDGTIAPTAPTFTARFHDGHWFLDAGSAHGLAMIPGGDPVRLALFGIDATEDDLGAPERTVATATVEMVEPASSWLEVVGPVQLDPTATYKAVLLSVPSYPMTVRLEGDQVVSRLPSRFLRAAAPEEAPDFLFATGGAPFPLTWSGDRRPISGLVDATDARNTEHSIQTLEHVARWTQTARLCNPSGAIRPDDIALSVDVNGRIADGSDIRLEYREEGELTAAPRYGLSLTNVTQRPLHFAVLELGPDHSISAGLTGGASVELVPGDSAFLPEDDEATATIPDALWEQGAIESTTLLKVIVSTRPFEPWRVEQPQLHSRRMRSAGRRVKPATSLAPVLRDLQQPTAGRGTDLAHCDWQSWSVAITTVRRQPLWRVPGSGDSLALRNGGRLEGHPALSSRVRLTNVALAGRELGDAALPRLLFENPRIGRPLDLAGATASIAPLSVLEFRDIDDPSVVTPAAPLRLQLTRTVGRDEYVVAVAYDGTAFSVVGHLEDRSAEGCSLVIDRLPSVPTTEKTAAKSRTLTVFFQVLRGQAVALPSPAGGLAALQQVTSSNGPVRIDDLAQIRLLAASARRVLLLISGFVGDGRRMLDRLDPAWPGAYDLVLTFDHRPFTASIADGARTLKSALEAAGLGPSQDKVLDIVAHSTGGLVARWMIEQDGEMPGVRRLVLLGTSSGGMIQGPLAEWARWALEFGLNANPPWRVTDAAELAALLEMPTLTLEQAWAGSEPLRTLATSPDPGVPYVAVVGHARPWSSAFNLGESHDLVATVASQSAFPASWAHPVRVVQVACDHLSYLDDPTVRAVIAEALA